MYFGDCFHLDYDHKGLRKFKGEGRLGVFIAQGTPPPLSINLEQKYVKSKFRFVSSFFKVLIDFHPSPSGFSMISRIRWDRNLSKNRLKYFLTLQNIIKHYSNILINIWEHKNEKSKFRFFDIFHLFPSSLHPSFSACQCQKISTGRVRDFKTS